MPHPQHDGTVADADGFCLRVLDDAASGELVAAPCLLVATDACFLDEFAWLLNIQHDVVAYSAATPLSVVTK